jgi:hypothetical protein
MTLKFKRRLGFAACAPCVALLYLLLTMVCALALSAALPPQQAELCARLLLFVAMAVWGISLVVGLVATLICSRHMERNPAIVGRRKLKWRLAVIFWPVTVPFYWYFYMRRL